MSHETTIVVHDRKGSTTSERDPLAVAHTDDALRQVRADPSRRRAPGVHDRARAGEATGTGGRAPDTTSNR